MESRLLAPILEFRPPAPADGGTMLLVSGACQPIDHWLLRNQRYLVSPPPAGALSLSPTLGSTAARGGPAWHLCLAIVPRDLGVLLGRPRPATRRFRDRPNGPRSCRKAGASALLQWLTVLHRNDGDLWFRTLLLKLRTSMVATAALFYLFSCIVIPLTALRCLGGGKGFGGQVSDSPSAGKAFGLPLVASFSVRKWIILRASVP